MKKTIIKLFIFVLMQLSIDGVVAQDVLDGRIQQGPNPFKLDQGTTLIYSLKRPASVHLLIYNQFGHRVLSEHYSPGQEGGKVYKNYVNISRRNFSGLALPKGVYFYVVASNGRVLGKGKMAIV